MVHSIGHAMGRSTGHARGRSTGHAKGRVCIIPVFFGGATEGLPGSQAGEARLQGSGIGGRSHG